MWGKHFASMYEGSMRGSGPEFFSVWGYVISHMLPNRNHGTTVDLNPGIIAFLIGMDEQSVAASIVKMCEPDPKSRTKDEDGRKLVQISEYTYRVVNGDHYRAIRNEVDRREYQRIKQAQYRRAKKGKSASRNGEAEHLRLIEAGASEDQLQHHEDEHLARATAQREQEMPVSEQPSANQPET